MQMWYMTCGMWNMTIDIWHMTCNKWHLSLFVGLKFSQKFSSLALTVWGRQCFKDIFTKDGLVTQLINLLNNDKGVCRTASATSGLLKKDVCRTAPATPGLLNICMEGTMHCTGNAIYRIIRPSGTIQWKYLQRQLLHMYYCFVRNQIYTLIYYILPTED